ncbi:MAG: cyclic nucleotide-binding domain-containing protein [Magnetococcales bacterium]|nr:cyclic nucleotide-binding domain-containing protein [Magnetococcales bacterium]
MIPFNTLKAQSLFQGTDPETLQQLTEFGEIVDFKNGERIMSELEGVGQPTPMILLKLRGQVAVAKKFIQSEAAADVEFKAIDSEIFGEISWLLGTSPSAELISKGDSRFIRLDGDKLRALCEANDAFGRVVYQRLAKLLAERTVNLTQLTKQKKTEKPSVFEF